MVAAVGAEAEEVGVEETSAAKREREMDVEPSDPKRVRTDPLAAADEAAAAEPVAPVSDAALITAPELAPPPTAPDMVPPPSLPALVPPSGMPAMVPPLPPPTGDGWGAPPAVPAHGPAGGKVCKDFQNGVCHRGAGCRFEHVGASAANLPPAMTCKDFLNGVCTRGASCKFAHDGTPGVGAPPPPQVGAYGCGGGYGGYGGYGTPGGYGAGVHGGGYGGYGSGYGAPPSYGAPPYGGTCAAAGGGAGVCKDFLNGRCQRGAQCRFSHEGTPIAPVREQPVCKDFQNGVCTRGGGCRFKHVSEEPEVRGAPMGGQLVGMSVGGYPAYSSYYSSY